MIDRSNVQVFVFTRNPLFKVLILKRTVERGGFWQPLSGGIEKGEDYNDTIKREVYEETGIKEIKRIIDLNYNFTYKTSKNKELKKKMKDFCFAVEINKEKEIKLSYEHEEFLWCSQNEVKNILKWKYNLIAFNKLLKILNIK